MAPALIVPVAKAVYLCDGHLGFPEGKTDLVGIFNSITPRIYPHVHKSFVVFAQLAYGLGHVPFFIEIRMASNGQPVFVSNIHYLHFPSRNLVVQMAYTVQTCRFPQPGLYVVDLFCDDQWVADTTLQLS